MPTFVLSTIVALCFALHVYAGIFVITPAVDSVCYGGQPCEVRWLDDGSIPLLNAFGLSEVGVYTGNQQLVQRLPPVDVSDTHTLEFTPTPGAGPNSGAYYIAFSSVNLKNNASEPLLGFSPFFSLDQMTGSFESPLPAATSQIPIPSSLSVEATQSQPSIASTITVGSLSTSLPPPSSSSSVPSPSPSPASVSASPLPSGFSTSLLSNHPTSTSALPSTHSSPSPTPNGVSRLMNHVSYTIGLLPIVLFFTLF